MHFSSVLALTLAAATTISARAFEKRNLYVYATFYDDDACTENPGDAVSTANDGCLEEGGRYSIYFQSATNAGQYPADLVVSPASGCNCQSTCVSGIAAGDAFCANLNDYAGAANAPSYRFVQQQGGCSANNC